VFDIIPEDQGNAMMKEYSPAGKFVQSSICMPQHSRPHLLTRPPYVFRKLPRAVYFKVDVSDVESVTKGCQGTLAAFPKGSLAGGVHCAAFNRSVSALSPLAPCRTKDTDIGLVIFPASLVEQDDRLCQRFQRRFNGQRLWHIHCRCLYFRCKWVLVPPGIGTAVEE
jgi:hypothetical protein